MLESTAMVTREQIQALADEIASKFEVERIILFGSYAYGQPTEDSDVDLLVLMEFEGRAFTKGCEVSLAVAHDFPRDIILRAPTDAERRYREWDPLIRHAFDKGQVLYERRRARVAG